MATQIEELAVRFSAQTEELNRELNRLSATAARAGKKTAKKLGGIQRSLNAIGKAAKTAGGLLAAAFAVRKLFDLGMHFKNAARDAEEMESKFDAVFKSSSADVKEWAKDLADEVNRSRFALMDFASTFQDTFVPLGFVRGEAAKLSKTLVELAVDVSSFSNKMEKDVIMDFQSALVGNHETVRKYGIVITQTTLNQEILNSGLAKSKKEITELNKVQARLNLIMKGTSDAHGDAARTAGSQANREKELAAITEELSITMGQLLAPATAEATGAMIGLTTALNDLFGAMKSGTQQETLEDYLEGLIKLSDFLGDSGIFRGLLEGELEKVNKRIFETRDAIEKIKSAARELKEETERGEAKAAGTEAFKNRTRALIKAAKDREERLAKIKKGIVGATFMWEQGKETQRADFIERMRKRITNNQTEETQRAANESQQILEQSLRESEMMAMAFADTFAFAFEDLIFSGEKLGKILNSLMKDIVRLALRRAIIDPLAGKLGASLSGAFGFANGGVMTGSGPAPLNSYANGGVAKSPQVALFGEGTRPEAFVPLPDGRSIPVTMSNGGGGKSVTVINNNHFDMPVEKEMYAAIAQAAPVLGAQIQKSIADAFSGRHF